VTCPNLLSGTVLAEVRLMSAVRQLGVARLAGYNNTGNVCVWPSEEVLAYHCLSEQAGSGRFSGRRVLELGGGMTGLAGLLLAATAGPAAVHLTDGNSNSVDNLERIVARNKDKVKDEVVVTVGQLRWDDSEAVEELAGRWDTVLCADCLFFDAGRESLVRALHRLLSPTGVALVMAPDRAGTFGQFEAAARKVFDVDVQVNYNEDVWRVHQECLGGTPGYDPDIHYPKLITLRQKTEGLT